VTVVRGFDGRSSWRSCASSPTGRS